MTQDSERFRPPEHQESARGRLAEAINRYGDMMADNKPYAAIQAQNEIRATLNELLASEGVAEREADACPWGCKPVGDGEWDDHHTRCLGLASRVRAVLRGDIEVDLAAFEALDILAGLATTAPRRTPPSHPAPEPERACKCGHHRNQHDAGPCRHGRHDGYDNCACLAFEPTSREAEREGEAP